MLLGICHTVDVVGLVLQLMFQVGELLQDSLGLLNTGLNNLGIPAQTPQQFVTQAKSIVCKHNNMYSTVKELEEEVKMLEEQQEGLIKAKEQELVKEMTAARLASGQPVEESELILEAKRKVSECVAGEERQQQGKRGYSLTKVDSDQNNNNQDQVTFIGSVFGVSKCIDRVVWMPS